MTTAYDVGVRLARGAVARRRENARRATVSRVSKGLLLAEGDSWFDYPFYDVLECLEGLGYQVESVAHMGDNVEDMAFDERQLDRLTKRFEDVARRMGGRAAPKAVLLSGGGNDVAGNELAMLLNYPSSRLGALNQKVVEGVIDDRLRDAYETLIAIVHELSKEYFGVSNMRVILHGYAHPVPDGRGFLGGAFLLPGPWLEPGFRRKGHVDQAKNTLLIAEIIDHFNAMVSGLAARLTKQGADVRYVDLRQVLSNGPDYRQDWANELHPTRAGFEKVARAIETAI